MLALVNLRSEYRPFVTCLDGLPEIPPDYRALAARCTSEAELDRVLAWHRTTETVRPGYPLGLVIPESGRLVRKSLSHGGIVPLLFEQELPRPGLYPVWAQDELLSRTVVAALHRHLCGSLPAPLPERDRAVLMTLAAAGAAGWKTKSASRQVAMSKSTLERWLDARGLGTPGRLLRVLRVRAVELLLDGGVDLATATGLAGWSRPESYRQAVRRLRLRKSGPELTAFSGRRVMTDG